MKRASPERWIVPAVATVVSGTFAWASLASATYVSIDQQRQWQALSVAPLSQGGTTGMAIAATPDVQPVATVPHRSAPFQPAVASPQKVAFKSAEPIRIRGVAGEGLYWSLRAAGASTQVAADYLAALATQMDVGEVTADDRFDLVLGSGGDLLYAGLERMSSPALQLVRWTSNGRAQWVDAAHAERPAATTSGIAMPVQGPITSYFGYRYHPILHFTRFHAGVDIGAAWGSPIVAAGDGQVVAAGWSGGFGREVEIAHAGGLTTIYGHMSAIAAQPGASVRAGQLIGYVGSSGLSTGPHLHFEVRRSGTPVNPLAVRFTSAPAIDQHLAAAVRLRLQALLSVGAKRG